MKALIRIKAWVGTLGILSGIAKDATMPIIGVGVGTSNSATAVLRGARRVRKGICGDTLLDFDGGRGTKAPIST